MKRLDKLMIKQFIGPFVVTFCIAMFVLIMQALWQYLERIAGKGLSFFTVIELLSYKCVGLVPLALPLGLLISSVMVLGGMAEHYELASIKSAGTSLLRIMAPLIIFGVMAAGASFAVSDYVIPAANLQFGARMYDINQKKPTLNMEAGMFNEDFPQFTIRLGGRDTDGRHISDVLIYDHTRATTGNLGQITAKSGEMYSEADGQSLVMELNDGIQYSEQRPTGNDRNALPFIRTRFGKYTKVFDLSQFNLGITDPSLFETNRSMLASWQLQIGVDSILTDIAIRKQTISNQAAAFLTLLEKDTTEYRPSQGPAFEESYQGSMPDSLPGNREVAAAPVAVNNLTPEDIEAARTDLGAQNSIDREAREQRNLAIARENELVRDSTAWAGIYDYVGRRKNDTRSRIYNRARSSVRTIVSQAASTVRIMPGIYESKVKYIYDKHMKFSMAFVCIIFIFIGAPMGAIVRKGGFGYPILVSIIFFVIFIIMTIFCRKLAESFVVDAAVAGWLPCIILAPISLYITRQAMKDAKLLDMDSLKMKVARAFGRFKKEGAAAGAERVG